MAWKFANKPPPSLDQGGSLELTEEYIRLRAYKLFEQRGREHGHDIDDWLQSRGGNRREEAAIKGGFR